MPVTNYIWDEVNDTLLMEKDDAGNTTAAYTYEHSQWPLDLSAPQRSDHGERKGGERKGVRNRFESVHNPCYVSVPPPLPWPVGCPPNCFVGGTLVAVPTGWAPIERLTVGDLVVAFDFGAGAVVHDRIIGNHHAEVSSFVELSADGEVLRVTSQHPIYEQSRGWTCVRDLARGDHLLSREGVDVEIIEVRHVDQKALVFNLSVQEQRNYFVGSRAILVHNK